MFETEFLQVEAVDEGIDETYWVFLVDVSFECVGEERCLVSVQTSYVFAHCCSSSFLMASVVGSQGSSVMTR